MIVVDSSVWIAHLRNTDHIPVGKQGNLDDTQEVLVGDLTCWKCCKARSERHVQLIERDLWQFVIVPMLSPAAASEPLDPFVPSGSIGCILSFPIRSP